MGKILVVDDEADIVEMMTLLLEKDGHQISSASNGKEALEKIERSRPDLVILDLMMPEMDGPTMYAKLREKPATSSIPVMVVTAKLKMKELLETWTDVAAYVDKPFDPKSLREKVRDVLAKK